MRILRRWGSDGETSRDSTVSFFTLMPHQLFVCLFTRPAASALHAYSTTECSAEEASLRDTSLPDAKCLRRSRLGFQADTAGACAWCLVKCRVEMYDYSVSCRIVEALCHCLALYNRQQNTSIKCIHTGVTVWVTWCARRGYIWPIGLRQDGGG